MAQLSSAALTQVFQDLKVPNKDLRLRASHELSNQVTLAHRGLSHVADHQRRDDN